MVHRFLFTGISIKRLVDDLGGFGQRYHGLNGFQLFTSLFGWFLVDFNFFVKFEEHCSFYIIRYGYLILPFFQLNFNCYCFYFVMFIHWSKSPSPHKSFQLLIITFHYNWNPLVSLLQSCFLLLSKHVAKRFIVVFQLGITLPPPFQMIIGPVVNFCCFIISVWLI